MTESTSGYIGSRENSFENAIEVLSNDLQHFIDYLKATNARDWYLHKVRNKANTFYVYPINDGQNPDYPQKTARERCIALMENYRDGNELWSWEAITKEMDKIKKLEEAKL